MTIYASPNYTCKWHFLHVLTGTRFYKLFSSLPTQVLKIIGAVGHFAWVIWPLGCVLAQPVCQLLSVALSTSVPAAHGLGGSHISPHGCQREVLTLCLPTLWSSLPAGRTPFSSHSSSYWMERKKSGPMAEKGPLVTLWLQEVLRFLGGPGPWKNAEWV